jgi:hypothetical protein
MKTNIFELEGRYFRLNLNGRFVHPNKCEACIVRCMDGDNFISCSAINKAAARAHTMKCTSGVAIADKAFFEEVDPIHGMIDVMTRAKEREDEEKQLKDRSIAGCIRDDQ